MKQSRKRGYSSSWLHNRFLFFSFTTSAMFVSFWRIRQSSISFLSEISFKTKIKLCRALLKYLVDSTNKSILLVVVKGNKHTQHKSHHMHIVASRESYLRMRRLTHTFYWSQSIPKLKKQEMNFHQILLCWRLREGGGIVFKCESGRNWARLIV